MLGPNLPQGSESIAFHNTLFRISELCWIKAVRLTVPEIVVRVLSLILAIVWFFAMERAKGTYVNLEFLLAIFPIILAWNTAGSLRIGCSGDFEETYEARRGMQGSLFRNWIEGIGKREPGWLHLHSGNYDLLLNPHRVAWVRPCFQWKIFPLFVAGVFGAYLYLIGLGLNFESYPVLDEFQILIFDESPGTIRTLSYLMILTALVAFALSIKRSVEVCGTGGVQDVFPLNSEDQKSVLGILAGNEVRTRSAALAPKKSSEATKQTIMVDSSKVKADKEAAAQSESAEKAEP